MPEITLLALMLALAEVEMCPIALSADMPADPEVSQLVERCNADEASACFSLAYRLDEGQGVSQDYEEAAILYWKACELEHASSCLNLGVLASSGNLGTVDWETSAALYDRACQMDAGVACGDLSYRYVTGKGVEKDLDRAIQLGLRGCLGGMSFYACRMLGNALEEKGDLERAAVFYDAACKGKVAPACKELGDLMAAQQESGSAAEAYARAVPLLEDGCFEHLRPISCSMLARMSRNGTGMKKNAKLAKRASEAACRASRRYCPVFHLATVYCTSRRACARALQELRRGAPFGEVAGRYSEDHNIQKEGDAGFFYSRDLEDAILREVEKLTPGEISGLIRTGSGFHVIRLLEVMSHSRYEERLTSMAEDRP